MAPRKPEPPTDTEEQGPSFKPPLFDISKVLFRASTLGTIITATWIVAAKLNAIESRLSNIESGMSQKWTRNQMREYSARVRWENTNFKAPSVDEISTQIPN